MEILKYSHHNKVVYQVHTYFPILVYIRKSSYKKRKILTIYKIYSFVMVCCHGDLLNVRLIFIYKFLSIVRQFQEMYGNFSIYTNI